jgi:DNA-binding HxlR family transcriptional regulator
MNSPRSACSIAAALGVIGDRWSLLVIREIAYGAHRYGEIAEGTGAATDVLAARLKALTAAGVLDKQPYSPSGSRYEYRLTDAGRELVPILVQLLTWGDRWVNSTRPVVLEHAGHEIDPALVCRTCGEPVGVGQVSARSASGEVALLKLA